MLLLLPWHLTDPLGDGLNVTLPDGTVEMTGRPGTSGDPWPDLAGVYAGLADAVAATGRGDEVTVLSGDCVTALPVLAGLQRRGGDPALVWFDAHGDFHTEATTTSGYVGGLPLAKAVGRGDMTLPRALGLSPVAEDRVVLVDARDLDPPEVDALAGSEVRHVSLGELIPAVLPDGPVHLHVDLDVVDPGDLRGLRFPAPGGPSLAAVAAGVRTVAESRPVAALSIAATWYPDRTDRTTADRALSAVLTAAGRDGPQG
jgi:arginase